MSIRPWVMGALLVVLAGCGSKTKAPTQPATLVPSQVWLDLGLSTDAGGVFALAHYKDRLVAGGSLSNVGGLSNVSLMEWDGTRWAPFAVPPRGTVESLAIHGGSLIAGFSAPGDTANLLEAWDGARWLSLGSLNRIVLAMTPYKTGLAVGGQFTRVNGNYWPFIAWWDGTHWHNLGLGVINPVHALTVFRGDLIAAGIFWEAGGRPASNIARWDGQAWHPLGGGLDGAAMSLIVHDDRLYVGGKFDFAGGERVNGVASWDGAKWSSLGLGLKRPTTDAVFSLTLFNGELVATGRFPGAAARWRGGSWKEMPGLTSTVFASAVFDGRLVAGGTFRASNRSQPNLVARWVE